MTPFLLSVFSVLFFLLSFFFYMHAWPLILYAAIHSNWISECDIHVHLHSGCLQLDFLLTADFWFFPVFYCL